MLDWLRKTWILLAIIVAGLIIFGDAAQLAVTLYSLSAACLVLLLADFILDSREKWGLFPALDLKRVIKNASRSPIGSAFVFLGIVALIIAMMVLAVPSAHGAVLDDAKPYLPVLGQSLDTNWKAAPMRYIPAGQVEQESSWKSHATLKTSRELGRGLVQMTIAYNSKGQERFNIYKDACRARALSAWNWRNDPYNPRFQLTFLTLQDKSNFVLVRPYSCNDAEAWKCALVSYNAGEGRWLQRRRNAKAKGLPADRWDGGLALAYSKAEAATLYGRPLYEAVNEYPRVIFHRAEKYQGLV